MPADQKDRAQGPAELEVLQKRITTACKSAGIIRAIEWSIFGGASPGIIIRQRDEPETRAVVRSEEDVIASLEEDDPVWQDKARTVARYFREIARGAGPAERPKKTREPEPAAQSSRGFAALPYLVLDRLLPVMPDTAFKVYCALLRFEGYRSRQMWPGYDRIAEMIGQSKVTVWRSIKLLREAGLIKSRRQFSSSSVYERVPVTSKNIEAIVAQFKAPTKRKMSRKERASVPSRLKRSVPSPVKRSVLSAVKH